MQTHYTAIAVSLIHSNHWEMHNHTTGDLEVVGERFARWDGKRFFFLGTSLGLDRTCVALILKDDAGMAYKVYTNTPAHGATVSDVLKKLEQARPHEIW